MTESYLLEVPTEQAFLEQRQQAHAEFGMGPKQPVISFLDQKKLQELQPQSNDEPLTVDQKLVLESFFNHGGIEGDKTEIKQKLSELWYELPGDKRKNIADRAERRDDLLYRLNGTNGEGYQAVFGPTLLMDYVDSTQSGRQLIQDNWEVFARVHQDLILMRATLAYEAIPLIAEEFMAQLINGEVSQYVVVGNAIERINAIRFRLLDPIVFRQEWDEEENKYQNPRPAEHVGAYFNGTDLVIGMPLHGMSATTCRRYLKHELGHLISASSYGIDSEGKIFAKRTGLHTCVVSRKNPGQRIDNDTELNENYTERKALRLIGVKELSPSGAYMETRQLWRLLKRRADKLRPDIDLQDLYEHAYHQMPQTDVLRPERWPARKAFGQAFSEIFRPGYKNQIDSYVAVYGVSAAILQIKRDWRGIHFIAPKDRNAVSCLSGAA